MILKDLKKGQKFRLPNDERLWVIYKQLDEVAEVKNYGFNLIYIFPSDWPCEVVEEEVKCT